MKTDARAWGMLLCLCLLMMLTVGVLEYAAMVLVTNTVLSLHLDRTSLGTVVGINSLSVGLFAPIAGQLVHKWGARTAMVSGTLMLVIGSVALATVVESLAGLIFIYGIVIGVGVSLGTTVPSYTVASYWFSHRVAFAITSIGIATSLGGTIAAPLLNHVIAAPNGHWKTGWAVAAAGSVIAFLLAVLVVRNRPDSHKQTATDPRASPVPASGSAARKKRIFSTVVYRTPVEFEFRDAMRRTAVYWMLAGVVFGTCAMSLIMVHGVAHLLDLGKSPSAAASFIATVLGAGIVSNTIYAVVGDHIEPRYAFGAALLLAGLGMVQMTNPDGGLGLWSVAALLGLGFALPVRCLTTMFINYFGRASFSRFMGIVMFGMAAGPAVTVVAAGAVFDQFRSYSPMIYFFATACLFLACVLPFVRPPGADCSRTYVKVLE